IAGDVEKDLDRLKRIFAIIAQNVRGQWGFTLDGNENYKEVAPFRRLWESLAADDSLKERLGHLIFVEQPLHRDVALSPSVKAELAGWPDRPPRISDASDGAPGALLEPLDCG